MSSNISHTWQSYARETKRKGAVATLVVHIALIALCIFIGLTAPDPPLGSGDGVGVIINYGTTETGLGNDPPKAIDPATETTQAIAEATPEVQQETKQEVVTQDVEDAPVIKEPEKKKEVKPVKTEVKKPVKKTEETKTTVKQEPQVDTKSMYTGQKSDENNQGDEGITYGPGDQGDPNGDPSSTNYDGEPGGGGGGGGNGPSHSLTGRRLDFIPAIDENYSETGKVTVSIKVDRNGKVLFAKYTQKNSTTSDPTLIRLAEESARQAKFSPNSKAAEEQFGTITFTFKLK